MIINEGQLRFLRKGQQVTITIPVQYRDHGLTAIHPPPKIGRTYRAQLKPFTRGLAITVIECKRKNETWQVTIAPGVRTEQPRYLARKTITSGDEEGRGYTDKIYRAMTAEPEAVDDNTLQTFALAARENQQIREEQRLLDIHLRYAKVRERAAQQGIDTTTEDRAIHRYIRRLEDKTQRAA